MTPTPSEVQEWLEWASVRLALLPARGLRPSGYRVFWPDVPSDPWFAFGHSVAGTRLDTTAKVDIPIMDEILALPALIVNEQIRYIVTHRCLVHPVHGTHKFAFTRLAKQLHISRRRASWLFQKGLSEIALKMDEVKIYTIRSFMAPARLRA